LATTAPSHAGELDPDTLTELRRIGATELARRTGLSARRISDILTGRATPRKKTIARLRSALSQL